MAKSKAREYLDKNRPFILWLFDSKCLMCSKPSIVIHEVVPISHGRTALHPKNRVVLCNEHHAWAHDIGTRNSIPTLQEKRKEFLIRKFGLDEN